MHLIVVHPGGIVRTLYTDRLPLARLGRLTVTRASHVEYDNARQGWTVELAGGTHLPGVWASREEALRAEAEAVARQL